MTLCFTQTHRTLLFHFPYLAVAHVSSYYFEPANCSTYSEKCTKKVTSSERSASQIYRVTQRLMARSRRTPKVLILPMLFGPFRPPKPEIQVAGDANVKRACMAAENVDVAAGQVLVFGPRERPWRVPQMRASVVEKVPSGMGKISSLGVLRLRAIKRCVTR